MKQAQEQGMGVIAKRPIANAPWRYDTRPVGEYVEPYWERMQQLTLPRDYPLNELALRYIAHEPLVDNVIIGSANLDHIKENIKIIEQSPLPASVVQQLKDEFYKHSQDWLGQV